MRTNQNSLHPCEAQSTQAQLIQLARFNDALKLFFQNTDTSTIVDELLTAYTTVEDSQEYGSRNLNNLLFACRNLIVLVSELERLHYFFQIPTQKEGANA